MSWPAVIAAILAIIKSLLDGKAKADGKAEARTDALEDAQRSISKTREIERDAAVKHRSDPTDAAFDAELFRD